jgi:hypothetical protein
VRRLSSWGLATALAVWLGVFHLRLVYLVLVPRMALHPWLLSRGFRGYRDIVDQHEAGLPLLLSVLLPWAGSPELLLRSLLAALSVLTVCLVYGVFARAFDRRTALLAALVFAVWVPRVWLGMFWYETTLAPLYLAAYAAWRGDREASRGCLLAAGLALGVAVTVKQHAWAVVALYLLWILRGGQPLAARARRAAVLGLGVAVPFSAYLAYIAATGVFRDYAFWAWTYNLLGPYRTEAAKMPRSEELRAIVALLLPAVVLLLSAAWRRMRGDASSGRELGVACLALAAGATIYPRAGIFHLAAALPFLSAAFALALRAGGRRWRAPARAGALIGLAVSLTVLVPTYRRIWQAGPPRLVWYSELEPIARRVRALTRPGEAIFVFPDTEQTSNVYLLCDRPPPGIWAYAYPWYLTHDVVRRILDELEAHRPPVAVLFPGAGVDGKAAEDSAPTLARYIARHYREREGFSTAVGPARILTRTPP